MDWKMFDDPKETKWHLDGCLMAIGKDERNIPIITKRIVLAQSVVNTSGSCSGMFARLRESQFMVCIREFLQVKYRSLRLVMQGEIVSFCGTKVGTI